MREPIQMARFTTLMPGKACASARPLRNSESVSQARRCTNSRIIQPLRPPPKLVSSILENAKKMVRNRGAAGVGGKMAGRSGWKFIVGARQANGAGPNVSAG
jgi:hypothetical protein